VVRLSEVRYRPMLVVRRLVAFQRSYGWRRRMTRISRREIVSGALASAAIVASSSVRAQQSQVGLPSAVAASRKGPPVYLEYDQDALDRAYDQAPWAPNQAEVLKRRNQKRALARARLGSPQRFAYGSTEIEGLDVYATKTKDA